MIPNSRQPTEQNSGTVVAKANLWNRVPRRLLFVNTDCGVAQSNYLLFNIRTPTLALV
jgi:hypothetical protein